ncbi:uncharacterized protein LOC133895012 [Phragmites australis]|uniref:uncharacterized protein LOC133895012 n=1 Tax=Phragmites australis TaxID=29695 RepID=UPI002D7692C6|nr:uncharacterized protein LOC133895012 [Phragmites australis]
MDNPSQSLSASTLMASAKLGHACESSKAAPSTASTGMLHIVLHLCLISDGASRPPPLHRSPLLWPPLLQPPPPSVPVGGRLHPLLWPPEALALCSGRLQHPLRPSASILCSGRPPPPFAPAARLQSSTLCSGRLQRLLRPPAPLCCLCDRTITGGITRLKEHLVGGYGDILKYAKTTPAIAQEMQAALKGKKRPLLLDNDGELQGEDDDVLDVTEESQDASRSIVHPSSGTAAKRKQSSFLKFRAPKETNTKQFEIAIEATAQYGSGYKPPSYHELREPLLEKVVKETYDLRKRHEDAWKQYGCTLMSDGWTDRRGHHLINFLVNSPEGTFFLESIDASSEVHDPVMLADLLEKRISDIDVDKVVQVVTDNGANYKAAGKLLMERFPTLYWTPCAAHCLNLMLEDVGKLKAFKKPISRARHVTTFIYRHGRLFSAMREKTGGRDLVRPAATRFATTFLNLQSLHKHRDALRYLFTSDDWTSCKLAKTEAGKKVYDIVLFREFWNSVEDCLRASLPLIIVLRVVDGDERPAMPEAGKKVYDIVLSREFWNSVEDCLRASLPLIIVLRVVDGDERPAMPEVASLMNHAKERIKTAFCTENKRSLLNNILQIIEGRWDRQMDTPLYGAALFLNPEKFYAIQKENDKYVGHLRGCFNDVLARMVEDETLRNKIEEQSMLYEDQRGGIFKNCMALQTMKSKNPLDWWRAYGGRSIDLQRFAKCIVSLCASSSGCERNWSTFEFIHTKKRNRLEHKRLNDLIYVAYNRKITSRFQKRREEAVDATKDDAENMDASNDFDEFALDDF